MEQSIPKYFENCNTPDVIKMCYRELAMQYHPDRLGLGASEEQRDAATKCMQEINRQYSIAMALALRQQSPEMTKEQADSAESVAEVVRQAIEAIIHLPNLQIEIRGSWVWVFGETKAVKDQLKKAGFKWLPRKEGQPWAFMAVPSRSRGDWSHEEIVERYGSQLVNSRAGRPERLVNR